MSPRARHGAPARALAALVAAAAAAAAGCDPDVIVGRDAVADPSVVAESPVPWSARHETGDVSEWTGDGFGWRYVTDGASLVSGSAVAHGGSLALASTLTRTGALEQAVVGRRVRLAEGYYTAWFHLPSASGRAGRVLFKLSASEPYEDRFDLIAMPREADLGLELWDHVAGAFVTDLESVPALPIGEWFELEAFYRAAPDAGGRLVVWQNGALILDTGPRETAPDDRVTFIVGSVTEVDSADPIVTYVDDAAIRAGQYLPAP